MERLAHISKDFRTQTLDEHLEGTARLAAEFAAVAGEERCAAFLGRIHDAGKAAAKWQNYLKKSSGYDESIPEEGCSKGSHTSAGAAYILKNLPDPLNLLLAYTVAGHHAGLPDFYDSGHGDSILKRFFKDGGVLKTELLDDAEEYSQQPASEWSAPYALTRFYDEYTHMAVRFLFSCLVDADWLDTERFMKPEDFAARREPTSLNELKRRFDAYMEEMRRRAPETYVNRIRNQILERCIEAGGLAPGFFSLTVPTGGGKTLSSLAFALTHALAHGKRRIIIAEPYTSIIEQISKVLKYGADDDGEIKLRAARGETAFRRGERARTPQPRRPGQGTLLKQARGAELGRAGGGHDERTALRVASRRVAGPLPQAAQHSAERDNPRRSAKNSGGAPSRRPLRSERASEAFRRHGAALHRDTGPR